jgi:hypothetical protein
VDHEPHSVHHADANNQAPVHQEDRRHIEFCAGADRVIHDVGWGHSPIGTRSTSRRPPAAGVSPCSTTP